MRTFLLLAPFFFLFTACNEDDYIPAPPSGDVFIRLENASMVTFDTILVNTDADYNYGTLAPGQLTDYKEHGLAYRYAYVSLDVTGTQYVIQPIDYVGETPLEPGNYTYIITFDAVDARLFIELREEG